jgi:hypothetical protein
VRGEQRARAGKRIATCGQDWQGCPASAPGSAAVPTLIIDDKHVELSRDVLWAWPARRPGRQHPLMRTFLRASEQSA